MDRSWAAVAAARAAPPHATAAIPHVLGPTCTAASILVRQAIFSGLNERVIQELRSRGVDVEAVLLSDRAIDETLRDLHVLVKVFRAFAAPGTPGEAMLSCIQHDWHRGVWSTTTKAKSSMGVLFEFDGIDWAGSVDTSVLADPARGRRYENVSIHLPTDGCLMRSNSDAMAREDTVPERQHHHSRAFYEMTPLGASVLAPICEFMRLLVGAKVDDHGVDFEVLYCGSDDRLDCKCVDRRGAPALVRTVQVSFEPGWPAAPVPPNHPGPWAVPDSPADKVPVVG